MSSEPHEKGRTTASAHIPIGFMKRMRKVLTPRIMKQPPRFNGGLIVRRYPDSGLRFPLLQFGQVVPNIELGRYPGRVQ